MKRDSVFLSRFPFQSHIQVSPCAIFYVCRLKYPYFFRPLILDGLDRFDTGSPEDPLRRTQRFGLCIVDGFSLSSRVFRNYIIPPRLLNSKTLSAYNTLSVFSAEE